MQDPFCVGLNAYATISFALQDYSISGLTVALPEVLLPFLLCVHHLLCGGRRSQCRGGDPGADAMLVGWFSPGYAAGRGQER